MTVITVDNYEQNMNAKRRLLPPPAYGLIIEFAYSLLICGLSSAT